MLIFEPYIGNGFFVKRPPPCVAREREHQEVDNLAKKLFHGCMLIGFPFHMQCGSPKVHLRRHSPGSAYLEIPVERKWLCLLFLGLSTLPNIHHIYSAAIRVSSCGRFSGHSGLWKSTEIDVGSGNMDVRSQRNGKAEVFKQNEVVVE